MALMWKRVAGYENYMVSSNGEVKNEKTNKILKPSFDEKGYMEVWLFRNGKAKKFSIHRLVATAFIQNPENKTQVNHIDGNKTNNDLSNLEWVTNKENILHSFRVLGRKHSGGRKKQEKEVRICKERS